MDDNIHNWYERLVMQQLTGNSALNAEFSDEALSDIACVALNHLPPRYVRHSVDMSFYTSPQELQEMDKRIQTALSSAINYVRKHPSKSAI